MSERDATGRIRIVKMPKGEAPEWVRKAWIDVELPCYPRANCTIDTATGKHDLRGALSGKPVEPYVGYTVPMAGALEALQKKNPKAAAWWWEQGFPLRGADFHFDGSCAEEVSGMKPSILVDNMETGRWQAPGDR